MRRKVIMDCDPGLDDAIAMMLLLSSDEIEVIGITTEAGNAGLDNTTTNALNLLNLFGRNDIGVYRGLSDNVCNEQSMKVHGNNGLGGIILEESKCSARDINAVEFIRDSIFKYGQIDIITTGPLSNIAKFILEYPNLINNLGGLYIMGGSLSGGNVTKYAEANIYHDYKSADIVFNSGIKIYMAGLNVTHKSYVTLEEMNIYDSYGKIGSVMKQCQLKHYDWYKDSKIGGDPVHDACIVMYYLYPNLFNVEKMKLKIEIADIEKAGSTNVDMNGTDIYVITEVDRGKFVDYLFNGVESICDR